MDGVHDVGGKQGFGKIDVTQDDPPFAHAWEARMLGVVRALQRPPDWNVDKFRHVREQLPPVEYLTHPYFDQWYRAYAAMLVGSGLVSPQELASGRSQSAAPDLGAPMNADDVGEAKNVAARFARDGAETPRLHVGSAVVAMLDAPSGHTRLPHYVRGRRGVVIACHGAHLVPDETVAGRNVAEPLYTVSFRIADLFSEQKHAADVVNLEMWERYLDAAP